MNHFQNLMIISCLQLICIVIAVPLPINDDSATTFTSSPQSIITSPPLYPIAYTDSTSINPISEETSSDLEYSIINVDEATRNTETYNHNYDETISIVSILRGEPTSTKTISSTTTIIETFYSTTFTCPEEETNAPKLTPSSTATTDALQESPSSTELTMTTTKTTLHISEITVYEQTSTITITPSDYHTDIDVSLSTTFSTGSNFIVTHSSTSTDTISESYSPHPNSTVVVLSTTTSNSSSYLSSPTTASPISLTDSQIVSSSPSPVVSLSRRMKGDIFSIS